MDHQPGCNEKVREVTAEECDTCKRIEYQGRTYIRSDEADAVVLDAALHGPREADICYFCGKPISPLHAAVDGEGNPIHALCIGKSG